MKTELSRRRIWLARGIAIVADAVQIGFLPLLGAGVVSPLDDTLDVAAAAAFIGMLGFHPALLPTMALELVPFVDVFPTWTLAVLFVTRRRTASAGSSREADRH